MNTFYTHFAEFALIFCRICFLGKSDELSGSGPLKSYAFVKILGIHEIDEPKQVNRGIIFAKEIFL